MAAATRRTDDFPWIGLVPGTTRSALTELLDIYPEHHHTRRCLRTLASRLGNHDAFNKWRASLDTRWTHLLDRLVRTRNAITHGGPATADAVRSIALFASQLSAWEVQLALEAALKNISHEAAHQEFFKTDNDLLGKIQRAPTPGDVSKVLAWLEEGGPEAKHVRQAVTRDPTLWDLLDAPLWLDVVAAVAEPARDKGAGRSVAARRGALLNAYVDEAIQRGDQAGYTRVNVVRWLGRLAAPGDPVVASRWGPDVISVSDKVPAETARAVSSGFAVPLMALVALAGAAVLLRHAGVVVALGAAAGMLIQVLAQRLTGGRRTEDPPQVRPAGLARLGATVAVLGTILSALALTVAETVSTLVRLLPAPPKSIDWLALLAVFGCLVVVVGLTLAVVATVADHRSGSRSEPLPRAFVRRVGANIVITTIDLGRAVYVLGLGYLFLSAIPAPYVFSGACALGFFAVVGLVGFGTTVLLGGRGYRGNEKEDEVGWVPSVGLGWGVSRCSS
ncbi:hypothetical protein ACIHFD_61885 [Nonomuraea sp. NPDC051941]|uniref:hypothetical protein n=1 Tax=Nonomuraea sp. NPDC051941 TaxID=3364373 RepID=UPI0037CB935F